ncbi:CHAT domain-containing protein [Streptomyces sp. NBC_01013]|uniref:CHAT domain-containing protein n=1 Tax=Streptomyces sp. NBC_01013 TaxID=2903718 RepID=UPI00386C8C3F|nr:CHAT domain-containing protein [Streptomyces sp. NBC_01013]
MDPENQQLLLRCVLYGLVGAGSTLIYTYFSKIARHEDWVGWAVGFTVPFLISLVYRRINRLIGMSRTEMMREGPSDDVPPRLGSRTLIGWLFPLGRLAWVLRALLGRGVPVFAIGALYHPRPELITPAVLLAMTEGLLIIVTGRPTMDLEDAVNTAGMAPEHREVALRGWVYDFVLRRPFRRPDLGLIFAFSELSVSVLEGRQLGCLTRAPSVRNSLLKRGPDARAAFLESAGRALDIIDEVLPVDDVQRKPLELAVLAAQGNIASSIASVAGQPDIQLANHRKAVDYYEAAGLTGSAALERCTAADLLLGQLHRARAAAEMLAPTLADPELASPVLVLALVIHAECLMAEGSKRPAVRVLRRIPSIRITRGDMHRLSNELHHRSISPAAQRRLLRLRIESRVEALAERLATVDRQRGSTVRVQLPTEARVMFERLAPATPAGRLAKAERLMLAGEYGESLSEAWETAEQALQSREPFWARRSYRHLAQLFELQEDWGKVDFFLRRQIQVFEEMRTQVADPEIYQDLTDEAYAEAVDFLVTRCHSLEVRSPHDRPMARAFQIMEQARSAHLLRLLGLAAALRPPAAFASAEAQALDDVGMAQSRLAQESSFSSARQEQALADLKVAHDGLRSIWDQIEQSDPAGREYAAIRRGTPTSFAELGPIMRSMPTGAVLTEYFFTDKTLFVFIVRADDEQPDVVSINLGPDLVEAIESGSDRIGLSPPDPWGEALAPLVDGLLERTAPGDLIWFVPHGHLHHIPLHAIPVDEGPLSMRNPVCYTPSASAMTYVRRGNRSPVGRALVLADTRVESAPPHTGWEAHAVMRRFGGGTDLLVGSSASRRVFLDRLADSEYDVIHLACHGLFDERNPIASGLRIGDDVVTMADLSALRLNTSLVTLSACESGRGGRRTGDDLVGLTRALLHAGSRSVLVSLWKVDDISTTFLMDAFYTALGTGASKAEALRQAQERLRRITVLEAIDNCGHFAGPATRDLLLSALDIAELRSLAGDNARARADYTEIATVAPPGSAEYRKAVRMERVLRSGESSADSLDYDRTPYSSPYYWAPFILVGEW